MKQLLVVSALLLVSGTGWTQPSQDSKQSVPLGTVAREQRATRAAVAKPAVKVFTNDNLPTRPGGEGLTAATDISSEPSRTDSEQTAKLTSDKPHDESYFREQKAEITARLDFHRRELAVLQQKLAQGGMQYYADPNETLREEYSRSAFNKLTEQVEEKKQQIATDEKALEDLQDQLRREGGDAGWLR